MTLHRRGFALAVVVLAAAVLGSPAWAGTPTEQLKSQIDLVLKVLDDPDLKKENRARDRRASVRRIANDIFDFSETAKRSLARHWQSRTPAEREEFVQLFGDLLERSYISKIELYGGEKIGYIGESMDGDLATVRTRIVTRHGTEIPIDYKMHTLGSRWLVYDVSIERARSGCRRTGRCRSS